MAKGSLRSSPPDEHLKASLNLANDTARALGEQLYDFNLARDSASSSEFLSQAATASAAQVAALAGAIVPSLGPAIARAWEWLKRIPLGLANGQLASQPLKRIARSGFANCFANWLDMNCPPAKTMRCAGWLSIVAPMRKKPTMKSRP